MACCKNQGVPNECARYCDKSLLSACIDWSEQIHKCWMGNEGHVCCEEQGVPDKCIPYCELSHNLHDLLSNIMRNQKKLEIKNLAF